jgi:hypothetical protein
VVEKSMKIRGLIDEPKDSVATAQEAKDRYDLALVLMSCFSPTFRFWTARFITLVENLRCPALSYLTFRSRSHGNARRHVSLAERTQSS